jgi:hypothetical protein
MDQHPLPQRKCPFLGSLGTRCSALLPGINRRPNLCPPGTGPTRLRQAGYKVVGVWKTNMPHRELLTESQRLSLHAPASDERGMVRHYTLSSEDLALINRRRGDPNRLGFALMLCYLHFPGRILQQGEQPPPALCAFVAEQLGLDAAQFGDYAERDQTRREHLLEIASICPVPRTILTFFPWPNAWNKACSPSTVRFLFPALMQSVQASSRQDALRTRRAGNRASHRVPHARRCESGRLP